MTAAPELRVHNSRRVFLLALGVGVGGLAVLPWLDGLQALFFRFVCAVLIVVGVVGLVDRRPKLVLSDEGIVYAGWGRARIPWPEFAGYRWVAWRQQPYLQLVARRPDPLLERFSFVGRMNHRGAALIGMPTFAIPVTRLAVSAQQLEGWIRSRLPETPPAPS